MPHKTKSDTKEMVKLYNDGFSFEEIAKMFSMSRQAVWERLKRNNIISRTKKVLPFIMYDDIKFTPSEYGYYRATFRHKHILLHRYKYEKEMGIIPDGFEIHHIDGNKQNNDLDNFECLGKAEHTKKHSPHHNQHKNNKTLGIAK